MASMAIPPTIIGCSLLILIVFDGLLPLIPVVLHRGSSTHGLDIFPDNIGFIHANFLRLFTNGGGNFFGYINGCMGHDRPNHVGMCTR